MGKSGGFFGGGSSKRAGRGDSSTGADPVPSPRRARGGRREQGGEIEYMSDEDLETNDDESFQEILNRNDYGESSYVEGYTPGAGGYGDSSDSGSEYILGDGENTTQTGTNIDDEIGTEVDLDEVTPALRSSSAKAAAAAAAAAAARGSAKRGDSAYLHNHNVDPTDVESPLSYYDQDKVDSITLNHIPSDLIGWNWAAASIQLISCGGLAYVTLMHRQDEDDAILTMDFPSNQAVVDGDSTTTTLPDGEFIRAPEVLATFAMGWYSVWFVACSGFYHLLVSVIPFVRVRYEYGLARNKNVLRWLEYGVSHGLMHVSLAQVLGITNVHTLMGSIFGLTFVTCLFGYMHEAMNSEGRIHSAMVAAEDAKKQQWVAVYGATGSFALTWSVLLWYFGDFVLNENTTVVLANGASIWVWLLVIIQWGLDLCLMFLFWLSWTEVDPFRDYSYVNYEKGFIILSVVSKNSLAWVQFAAFVMLNIQ